MIIYGHLGAPPKLAQSAADPLRKISGLSSVDASRHLILAVARHDGGTQVDARTDIQGQVFDWGKSTRCLEELFRELSAAA